MTPGNDDGRRSPERETHDDGALLAALSALRTTPVPPPNELTRARILAAFDRERAVVASRRRGGSRYVPRGLVAAAVLVAFSWSLFQRAPDEFDPWKSIETRLAVLEARAERASLERSPKPVISVEFAPGSLAEKLRPDFEVTGNDPGLLRLVAARRLEGLDDAGALNRYRALVERYAESPAAVVAKQRIELLAP